VHAVKPPLDLPLPEELWTPEEAAKFFRLKRERFIKNYRQLGVQAVRLNARCLRFIPDQVRRAASRLAQETTYP